MGHFHDFGKTGSKNGFTFETKKRVLDKFCRKFFVFSYMVYHTTGAGPLFWPKPQKYHVSMSVCRLQWVITGADLWFEANYKKVWTKNKISYIQKTNFNVKNHWSCIFKVLMSDLCRTVNTIFNGEYGVNCPEPLVLTPAMQGDTYVTYVRWSTR